uniref:Uncharacterized protein n=1 Tax=Rhizophora mucronata TaxID=61149 RepID=A0A2P2K805_RHIMU
MIATLLPLSLNNRRKKNKDVHPTNSLKDQRN